VRCGGEEIEWWRGKIEKDRLGKEREEASNSFKGKGSPHRGKY